MLLAIDTATSRASIALHDGAALHGECTWEAHRRHTVTLVPRIREMLESAGVTFEEITAVAVCVGPGSYTGVRIGVSAAKGMATVRRLPLVGVRTLDILVAAQPADPRALYAIFAAGRKRVGYARYRWSGGAWRAETDVEILTEAKLSEQIDEPALVVGEIKMQAWGDDVEIPPPARHLRRAGYLADLGWAQLRSGCTGDPASVNPIYAR